MKEGFVKCKDGAILIIPGIIEEVMDNSNSLRIGDSRERVRHAASTVLYFDEPTYALYKELYKGGLDA